MITHYDVWPAEWCVRGLCAYTGRTLPECRIPIVKLYLWTAGQRVADSAKKSRFVWKVKTRDSKACTTNSMTYTHWLPCEPNSVHGNEACLALQPRGKDYGWNDVQCHYSACFICEMPGTTTTLSCLSLIMLILLTFEMHHWKRRVKIEEGIINNYVN